MKNETLLAGRPRPGRPGLLLLWRSLLRVSPPPSDIMTDAAAEPKRRVLVDHVQVFGRKVRARSLREWCLDASRASLVFVLVREPWHGRDSDMVCTPLRCVALFAHAAPALARSAACVLSSSAPRSPL